MADALESGDSQGICSDAEVKCTEIDVMPTPYHECTYYYIVAEDDGRRDAGDLEAIFNERNNAIEAPTAYMAYDQP